MKKLLLGLFIFGLFAIYGQAYASDLNLTSTDSAKSFDVVKDQIISITLCNPGDSGSKFDIPQYDSSILSLISHINVPLNPPNPPGLTGGCYGNDVFKFQALNSGFSKINITASQPWTGGSTATMFSSNINVSTITTPSIVVTSPNNGGESVEVGGKIEIRWMSSDIVSALNEVYVSDGIHKGHTESIRMENYLGSLIYTLDSNLIPGSNYKAYVSTAYGSAISASDSSDLPFTIKSTSSNDGCLTGSIYSSTNGQVCPAYTNAKITVLNPSVGSTYAPGQTTTITWTKELPGLSYITFYKSDSAYVSTVRVTNNPDTSGSMSYTFPLDMLPGQYKVNAFYEKTINGVSSSIKLYESNGYFNINSSTTDDGCSYGKIYSSATGQICPINTTPKLTLISPNGGENFKIGDQVKIKWNSENLPVSALIAVYLEEPATNSKYGIGDLLTNDGEETISLTPAAGISNYGKNFKINIVYTVDKQRELGGDSSDGLLTISSPSSDSGCSNSKIYSSTTGALCPKVIEENSGCYGARYSLITGKACPLSMVTDEGCKAGQTYSSTTGQKCIQAIIQTVDQGCNGSKYSTTTGNMCPIVTITVDEGCLAGQNFSSTTGQKCIPSITPTGTIKRTLRWGLSGDDVKALQKNLGFLNTDGIYGTWTMIKVKEWQAKNGLNADGVFGPGSRSKMGL